MNKQWVGCAPGNFRQGRPSHLVPEAIVIHIMVGSMAGTDAWFNDPKSVVSAHYGVAKNGEVHQYVQETDTAFHAGIVENPTWKLIKAGVNPNFYTIGIEHEGFPDDPWPETQYDASAALIAEVVSRWNIPLDEDHVVRHHEIRASKTCPGNQVQISELIRRAVAKPVGFSISPVPQVTTLVNVNLRRGAPTTDVPIVNVIPANTAVTVPRYTDAGERVRGNSFWYTDGSGNFLWAGATDVPNPAAFPLKDAGSPSPVKEKEKEKGPEASLPQVPPQLKDLGGIPAGSVVVVPDTPYPVNPAELVNPAAFLAGWQVDRMLQQLEAGGKLLASSAEQAAARAKATLALVQSAEVQGAATKNPGLAERLPHIAERAQTILRQAEAQKAAYEQAIARMRQDAAKFGQG